MGTVVVLVAFRALLPDGPAENESPDFTLFYRPVAERIADGEGLTLPTGQPALRYAPLYPAMLAGAYELGDLAGLSATDTEAIASVGLMAVAALLVHLISRRVFGPTVAWVSVVLWVLYPVVLWTAKQPNSEIPFMVLLYASVLVLLPTMTDEANGSGRLAGAGLLLGAAALVRPVGLTLLVPIGVVLAWRARTSGAGRADVDRSAATGPHEARRHPVGGPPRREWRVVGMFVAGFAVVVVPWCVWASARAGHLVVIADTQNADVKNGLSLSVDDPNEADRVLMPGAVRDVVLDARAVQPDAEDPEPLGSFLVEQARERPIAVLGLLSLKGARAWYATESFRFELPIAVTQLAFLGTVVAGAHLAGTHGPAARWYLRLTVGITLATWLATVAVLSIVRYLVPVLGLLVPFAGLTVVAVVRWLAAPRDQRMATGEPLPSSP